jgi:glycosyltransferase involved in cell wall biosynthesis
MRIRFLQRESAQNRWAGDLRAIAEICRGLQSAGHQIVNKDADFTFLSNTLLDLRKQHAYLGGKKHGIICFHEDGEKYFGTAFGFFIYILNALQSPLISIDRLIANPQVIHPFAPKPNFCLHENQRVIEEAHINIVNAEQERSTLMRDFPQARSAVVKWTPGFVHDFPKDPDDSFPKWIGADNYLLQIGRLEPRKNQLATILATRDLDIPLVLIGTSCWTTDYEEACLEIIRRYRKSPTIYVAQGRKAETWGNLRIIPMPDGRKLSLPMLASAYKHAGMQIHPAFGELPGYTYLEGAYFGIPTIASHWTTIRDYFTTDGKYDLDDRILYVTPHNIEEITRNVKENFGKKYSTCEHRIFNRQPVDIGKEIELLL